jgi:hypothetical protein
MDLCERTFVPVGGSNRYKIPGINEKSGLGYMSSSDKTAGV